LDEAKQSINAQYESGSLRTFKLTATREAKKNNALTAILSVRVWKHCAQIQFSLAFYTSGKFWERVKPDRFMRTF